MGREAGDGGEGAGKDRRGREAAAGRQVCHPDFRMLGFEALGLPDAMVVHKLVEGDPIFRVDEMGEVGAVHRQHGLQVQKLEIRIQMGLLALHPFFQHTAIVGGIVLRMGRRLFPVPAVFIGPVVQQRPRIPAEEDLIGAVRKHEDGEPELGEPARVAVRNAHVEIDKAHQDKHGQVTHNPLYLDVLEGGVVLFAPEVVFLHVGKQKADENKRIQDDEGDAGWPGQNSPKGQAPVSAEPGPGHARESSSRDGAPRWDTAAASSPAGFPAAVPGWKSDKLPYSLQERWTSATG